MPRFNRADLVSCIERDPGVSEEAFGVAKQIASSYLAMCKARASWMRPFNMAVPVEHQRVFKHFVSAAVVVLEVRSEGTDASAKDYVAAQFEGLAWTNKIPFPAQLATPSATIRFSDYMSKKNSRAGKVVRPEDNQHGRFDMEDRKAERVAERMGVSIRRALRTLPREFTEPYLRHRGVWESVQSAFND